MLLKPAAVWVDEPDLCVAECTWLYTDGRGLQTLPMTSGKTFSRWMCLYRGHSRTLQHHRCMIFALVCAAIVVWNQVSGSRVSRAT